MKEGRVGPQAIKALGTFFDFSVDDARRIPGVLWDKNRLNVKGLERIEVAVEN